MTLVLKLDLDMVKISHHTKNEVSMSRHSKVIAQTDRQTHRQYENIINTRAVIILIFDNLDTDLKARSAACRDKRTVTVGITAGLVAVTVVM